MDFFLLSMAQPELIIALQLSVLLTLVVATHNITKHGDGGDTLAGLDTGCDGIDLWHSGEFNIQIS